LDTLDTKLSTVSDTSSPSHDQGGLVDQGSASLKISDAAKPEETVQPDAVVDAGEAVERDEIVEHDEVVEPGAFSKAASAVGKAASVVGRGLGAVYRITAENRHYINAVLCGFLGDRLDEAGDPRAISMSFRQGIPVQFQCLFVRVAATLAWVIWRCRPTFGALDELWL